MTILCQPGLLSLRIGRSSQIRPTLNARPRLHSAFGYKGSLLTECSGACQLFKYIHLLSTFDDIWELINHCESFHSKPFLLIPKYYTDNGAFYA